MSESVIFILIFVGVSSLIGVAAVFAWPYLRGGEAASRLRTMVKSRGGAASVESQTEDAISRLARMGAQGEPVKLSNAEMTLEKRLMFAHWDMSPTRYYLYTALVTFIFFSIAYIKLNTLGLVVSLFAGRGVMNALVNKAIQKRFNKFDRDYAPFLLSLVGLLKTGMNPIQALGTASSSLENDSLVRFEVELMLERIRAGAPEDKSVGAFGSDINHPEIELFVQALLLSMRLGGTLSDTLERLAKQVRRRQFFRSQAVAAVGLQRGSIWFILCIQTTLMVFIYFILPTFIIESATNPIGWQVWQGGIFVMMMGMLWVRLVSNIRC